MDALEHGGEAAGVEPGLATVLMVEDTPALARTYLGFLRDEPYAVEHVETGAAAKARLEAGGIDLVLLDLRLPDIHGLEVLAWMRAQAMGQPVVVITAEGSVKVAVEAMRAGAADFLMKPFPEDRLLDSVRVHLDRARFERTEGAQAEAPSLPVEAPKAPRAAPAADAKADGFEGFIGASVAMRGVYRVIRSAASSSATVFITGESGTGKEVCAEAVHATSLRADGPFVALNCAAIPGELMESEIFGHVKGAFTGATADKKGAARLADGGTLFLDELCEMSLHLQTKLLRFVQTGSFNPVGQPSPEKVDVRFVCATNRDPLAEVEAGRFREDLYYRLHVIPIHLPPLRSRGEDVLLIARRFLAQFSAEEGKAFEGFDAEAEAAIAAYAWPGNVRQLQNVLRSAVVLGEGPLLSASMLRAPVGTAGGAPPVEARSVGAGAPRSAAPDAPSPDDLNALSQVIKPLHAIEREAIERAVALCGGDVRKAAVFLDVSPATIYRKLKAWRTPDN